MGFVSIPTRCRCKVGYVVDKNAIEVRPSQLHIINQLLQTIATDYRETTAALICVGANDADVALIGIG